LHWWLLRANSESEAEYDKIVNGLSKQLNDGKSTLWEAHEQVTDIIKDVDMNDKNNNSDENVENAQSNNNDNNNNISSKRQHQPDGKPTRAAAAAAAAAATTSTTTSTATATTATATNNNKPNNKQPHYDTIHIDVLSGPNEGLFYDLQPRTRLHSWIGRSQGRKFKQKGISLPKDLECSTTHGRFEYTNNNNNTTNNTNTNESDGDGDGPTFYYVDVGSTNGTQIDGIECEPNVSYVLTTGMNILCGKTTLKITLLSLD